MIGSLKPLTEIALSGTGTIELDGFLFGGYDLSADGTNAASITIRDNDSNGTVLADTSSTLAKFLLGPMRAPSGKIYYSISGTGGKAMLYEWIT